MGKNTIQIKLTENLFNLKLGERVKKTYEQFNSS